MSVTALAMRRSFTGFAGKLPSSCYHRFLPGIAPKLAPLHAASAGRGEDITWTSQQRWSRGHKARGQGQGHKKIQGQGQGQPFRGQNLSRPRTEMLEAKDQGHSCKCSPKKKVFKIFFQAIPNL